MDAGYQTPRLVDYETYHPNLSYLDAMYQRIKNTSDYTLWEQFAAFLLPSIDGWEPITNLKPGEG